ncbi:hypothetical protein MBLNU459_g5544t2 [Dothideomycetes sp. NU459]
MSNASNPSPDCAFARENLFGPIVMRGFAHHSASGGLLAPGSSAPIRIVEPPSGGKKVLAVLHETLSLLAIWAAHDVPRTRATLAAATLTMVGPMALLCLSLVEHQRSLRPSIILEMYLGLSTLLDLARVRTLFYLPSYSIVASLYCLGFSIKLIILLVEVCEKQHLLLQPWRDSAPEDLGGVYNRSLFLWLNGLLARGFHKTLTIQTLMSIDRDLLDSSTPLSLASMWEQANKKSPHALLRVFFWHYKSMFFSGIPPCLARIAFELTQPFLIQRVLTFVRQPVDNNTTNIADGLTAAYAIVYIGIAVSSAYCDHKAYRLLTAFRGSLITMVYEKTLRISNAAADGAEAITLMSADIDRIGSGMQGVHLMYGSVIQVGVTVWLLYRLLGVAIAVSATWYVVGLVIGWFIARAAGRAQVPWLEAISLRLAATSKALMNMKAIKISGLTRRVTEDLRDFREKEIKASLLHRFYNVFVFTFSYASTALSPPIAFGVFVLLARAHNTESLTTATSYAALTLFLLMDQPLITLVEGYGRFQGALIAFTRIQEYLMSDEREELRLLHDQDFPQVEMNGDVRGARTTDAEAPSSEKKISLIDHSTTVAKFVNVSASYSADRVPIVTNLNFEVRRGTITMLVGPVGCGKSTLLKSLLGEMPVMSGTIVTTFNHVAYCSQTPWIFFGSLRQNIIGTSPWDAAWYACVVKACSLDADFAQLPDGDLSETGSGGSRLSGGQKIRVALARALYPRSPVVILDSCLSGLDNTTESAVAAAIFGREGLFRQFRTTVLAASSSASYLTYADNIIALGEHGEVAEQGSYASLLSTAGFRIGFYLGVYFMLGALQIISMCISSWIYMLWIVPQTGRKFHEFLLQPTMGATVSFLTSTDIGLTTNRFGQDLELIDNDLQQALSFTVIEVLLSVGEGISIVVGSGYLAATLPGVLVVLYFLQRYYLRTSRQLRLLDLEAKAPLFSGFLEALNGLSTIRAYGWTDRYKQRGIEDLNRSQKPYYLLWSIQRWLTLVLGLISAGLAVLLVGIVTHVHNSSTIYLATALLNIVGLSSQLQQLVQQWTQLETALGAVSRVRNFALNTPQDGSGDEQESIPGLPEYWPLHGAISFSAVSAHYQSSTEPVLKDINLNIRSGEKIAFCGRTGSGKSSLIGTLLRVLELNTGTVTVDGQDLTEISRGDIRDRFNTLSQDPVLLHGSIRDNLDVRGHFGQDDGVVVDALRSVNLHEVLLGGNGSSLDDELNEDLLSHGQRQLFCLARSVIASHHSSVVIMDEATSSVDNVTDAQMQAVIRERFRGKTVIMVAHKVRTVLDFDRIAVLDNGCIVECDSPAALLEREDSAFRSLYEAGEAS